MKPILVHILDIDPSCPEHKSTHSSVAGQLEYERLLVDAGECSLADFTEFPKSENDFIALNYTSGTTGQFEKDREMNSLSFELIHNVLGV